jgi:hypothetical protein
VKGVGDVDMDKAIDKGNLIDFFAVLMPGMFSVILCCLLNMSSISFSIVEDTMSNLALLILIFIIGSYIAGLLLMELAVILQRLFPSGFDYYREAVKKETLSGKGAYLLEILMYKYLFTNDLVSKDIIIAKIEKQIKDYEKREFWLLTHNYAELVERKKAYSMMNRSLAMAPITCLLVQSFIIYIIKKGECPPCWQLILVFAVEIIFYYRARRQAKLLYHEVNMIYECASINKTNS